MYAESRVPTAAVENSTRTPIDDLNKTFRT